MRSSGNINDAATDADDETEGDALASVFGCFSSVLVAMSNGLFGAAPLSEEARRASAAQAIKHNTRQSTRDRTRMERELKRDRVALANLVKRGKTSPAQLQQQAMSIAVRERHIERMDSAITRGKALTSTLAVQTATTRTADSMGAVAAMAQHTNQKYGREKAERLVTRFKREQAMSSLASQTVTDAMDELMEEEADEAEESGNMTEINARAQAILDEMGQKQTLQLCERLPSIPSPMSSSVGDTSVASLMSTMSYDNNDNVNGGGGGGGGGNLL